ncbi:unnamed protein product, partial [Ixodes hexagonus]
CDEERFNDERERCDFAVKLRLLVSHGDPTVACSAMNKYKMCLARLIGQTMCGQREFLVRQLEPMRLYLQREKVRYVNAYYDCLNAVLGSAPCQSNALLMKHVDYFPTILTRKYTAACEEELLLAAVGVVDTMRGECFEWSYLD